MDEGVDDGCADVKVLVLSVLGLRVDDFTTVAVDVRGEHLAVATDHATEVADLVGRMSLDGLPLFADVLSSYLVDDGFRLCENLRHAAKLLRVVGTPRDGIVVFCEKFDASNDLVGKLN